MGGSAYLSNGNLIVAPGMDGAGSRGHKASPAFSRNGQIVFQWMCSYPGVSSFSRQVAHWARIGPVQ